MERRKFIQGLLAAPLAMVGLPLAETLGVKAPLPTPEIPWFQYSWAYQIGDIVRWSDHFARGSVVECVGAGISGPLDVAYAAILPDRTEVHAGIDAGVWMTGDLRSSGIHLYHGTAAFRVIEFEGSYPDSKYIFTNIGKCAGPSWDTATGATMTDPSPWNPW